MHPCITDGVESVQYQYGNNNQEQIFHGRNGGILKIMLKKPKKLV